MKLTARAGDGGVLETAANGVNTLLDASAEDRLTLDGESLETLNWKFVAENRWVGGRAMCA